MQHKNIVSVKYSVTTLVTTAIVGIIILLAFPTGGTASSILFILMNLLPMIAAFVFSRMEKEVAGVLDFLRQNFLQKETVLPFIAAAMAAAMYYGVSALLGNVHFTGAAFTAVLAYLPWTILQGGLEEVGWRWYLQSHLNIKNSFFLKMLVISVIWFLWHIPIYMLPWITSASSNYFISYMMILGNTFTFGAVREVSKGSLPCVLGHMLIDALAVVMLVQSDVASIMVLAAVEIAAATLFVSVYQRRKP
ncbi:MAG TPA: CPBP family intramembrane metalloprotease [Candidatus Faecousia intestinigallinarum]|nr:CPBP family intramembrane metalloprotease [Candidatus Faecousia intestinigallinarum]